MYITNDPLEIISGTKNRTSPVYTEAAKDIFDNQKGVNYIKNFIISIENIASKNNVIDKRISESKGNIRKFSKYDDIERLLQFLSEHRPSMVILKQLSSISKALEKYQTEYIKGYEKQIRLVTLEYETALYMLVTGVVFTMANYVEIKEKNNNITVVDKNGKNNGIISKIIEDLAKELNNKDHKEYLQSMIQAKDNVPIKESAIITEASVVAAALDLVDTVLGLAGKTVSFGVRTFRLIRKSIFGIVPLIRSIIYLSYKKKADTVLALEQQSEFIKMNIEQLKLTKGMDEKKKANIIKRQQAYIEQNNKRAEKLRAQFVDTEQETVKALKKDEPSIKEGPPSDEFVLA